MICYKYFLNCYNISNTLNSKRLCLFFLKERSYKRDKRRLDLFTSKRVHPFYKNTTTKTMSSQHCTPAIVANVSRGVVDVIGIIMTITIIIMLHKTISFLRNQSSTPSEKVYHVLFWSGVVFQIISALAIIDILVGSITYCIPEFYQALDLQRGLFTIFLAMHYYMLLLILFIRVYFAFQGSMFALTKCTVKTYIVIYIIEPILFILGGFMYIIVDSPIGLMLIAVAVVFILSLIISIVALYVQKLIQVYKLSKGDEHYMSIITKTTILTMMSVIVTCFGYIPFFMVNYLNGYTYWIMELSLLIDIYTNYICVVVGYPVFATLYNKLCGGLDLKCRNCCGKLAGIDVNESNIAKNIQISQANSSSPGARSTSPESSISGGGMIQMTIS